jgi:hypothetical protein
LAADTAHRTQASPTSRSGVDVRLDTPLPRELAVGRGTAVFVCGTCFAAGARIDSLAFVVDGEDQPVMAAGMPRLDLLRALHPGLDPFATAGMAVDEASAEDPLLTSYRSGFWGFARIAPREGTAPRRIELRVRFQDGG